ncbi:MT-A70 family methyltransferase [Gulosibacter molinativorax]|uniref:Methyltransferase n=1 Tax=Gulosibacter molinativorax TaxID=256821 RepID=A0ABT7CC43_9MICO|nr:MT-A70 family methyltransferase [Gulosibacter molinativorax]MDJ1372658.1 methyltransferase [Gulosibacter molinativorax]QUY62392.1 Unknown protein [Gulosibacter molinativorax]
MPTTSITTINTSPEYPQKRYKTLVMDPPWDVHQKGKFGAERHYSLMTLDHIAKLPVPDLLEENAHVWVWCTVATRFAAQQIAEQVWGLKFRSEGIWDKRKTGLGQYLRGSHETLLLLTRGKAPILYRSQRDVFDFPVQDHSHKPEEAMVMITRCSPGPYLELFARRRFPGFDHWGFEAPGGSDVHIPGFPVPGYSARALDPRPGSNDDWHDGIVRGAGS